MSASASPKKDAELMPSHLLIFISTATLSSLKQAAQLVKDLLESLEKYPDRNAVLIEDLRLIQDNVRKLIAQYNSTNPMAIPRHIEFLLSITNRFVTNLSIRSRNTQMMLNNMLRSISEVPDTVLPNELAPRFPTSEEMRALPPSGVPSSVESLFVGMQFKGHPLSASAIARRTDAIPFMGHNGDRDYNDDPNEEGPSNGVSILAWRRRQGRYPANLLPNAPFSTPPGLDANRSPPAPLPDEFYRPVSQPTRSASPAIQVAGPSHSANRPRGLFTLEDDPSLDSFYVTEKSDEDYVEGSTSAL